MAEYYFLIIPSGISQFNIWQYTCIHAISKNAKYIELHPSHTINTQTESCPVMTNLIIPSV